MSGTLLVATDGSPPAQLAVEVGVRLARERGGRVAFLHCSPTISTALFERNPYKLDTADEIVAVDPTLRSSLELAQQAGVDADVTVLGGHGADLIATAVVGTAEGIGAEMIVVGARGRGAIAEAVLGSVSRAVVKLSDVPVIVVHSPHAAKGGYPPRQT